MEATEFLNYRRSIDARHAVGKSVALQVDGEWHQAWLVGHDPDSILLELNDVMPAGTEVRVSLRSTWKEEPLLARVGEVVCVGSFFVYLELFADLPDRVARARWSMLLHNRSM